MAEERQASPRPTVYIETIIVSHLTAWPSRDVVRLSYQMLTREWWMRDRPRFKLYASQLVIDAAATGDSAAAAERVNALANVPLLALTREGLDLAQRLAQAMSLPGRARLDAGHIAVAAVHGISFLLTWQMGCLLPEIQEACLAQGYAAPQIVTPEQMTELP